MMRIGIIGSGIAGLVAGKMLANAGHEIIVVEKNRGYGGKIVSMYGGETGKSIFDYGTSCFSAETPEFSSFVAELISRNLLKIWGETYSFYDGKDLLPDNPNRHRKTRYAAVNGMSAISHYLGRSTDFVPSEAAGGITRVATGKGKKRPWMINLSSFNTLEVDAVIVATPAPEAYSIILTAQDEIDVLTAIREIDAIDYTDSFVLMASYRKEPDFDPDAIISQSETISFVSNETSKRPGIDETALVVHSTPGFARKNREAEKEDITQQLLTNLSSMAGRWTQSPHWTALHYWRHDKPKMTLDRSFMDIGVPDAPLALVGDYFHDSSTEGEYCSGVRLAREWINKFGGQTESDRHRQAVPSAAGETLAD